MDELDLVVHRDCRKALTMHVKLDKDKSNDSSPSDIRNCKYSPAYRTTVRLSVMLTALIVILSLCSETAAMPSCHMGCLNGGKLLVPDGPFAYCLCKCPHGFVGFRCEFNKMLPRRIRRVNRLKRLVKIRNEVRNEVEGLLSGKRRRHRHFKR